eukprot:gene3469-657_t
MSPLQLTCVPPRLSVNDPEELPMPWPVHGRSGPGPMLASVAHDVFAVTCTQPLHQPRLQSSPTFNDQAPTDMSDTAWLSAGRLIAIASRCAAPPPSPRDLTIMLINSRRVVPQQAQPQRRLRPLLSIVAHPAGSKGACRPKPPQPPADPTERVGP